MCMVHNLIGEVMVQDCVQNIFMGALLLANNE